MHEIFMPTNHYLLSWVPCRGLKYLESHFQSKARGTVEICTALEVDKYVIIILVQNIIHRL